jgi:hypothetical protein
VSFVEKLPMFNGNRGGIKGGDTQENEINYSMKTKYRYIPQCNINLIFATYEYLKALLHLLLHILSL